MPGVDRFELFANECSQLAFFRSDHRACFCVGFRSKSPFAARDPQFLANFDIPIRCVVLLVTSQGSFFR